MDTRNELELPGTQRRIISVLASDTLRSALADRAIRMELAPHRGLEFPSKAIAEQLDRRRSIDETIDYFDARQVSEAIILLSGRPVLFVKDGVVQKADLPEIEAKIAPHRQNLIKAIRAVGRIELSDHDTYDWCGTGWRIDEDLIVTNRHVANLFARRHGTTFRFRHNSFGRQLRARVDFLEEFKATQSEEFGVAKILWIADDSDEAPDMAILQIKLTSELDQNLPEPLSLSPKDPEPRQSLAVVGYPAKDSRNDVTVMTDIFLNTYDVKRFAPGEVVSIPSDVWYLTHDASTLGGNSGSAVIDLESQQVLGLHFGGSFRRTNYAVKSSVIKAILSQRSWVGVAQELPSIPTEAFAEKERTLEDMEGRAGYQDMFLELPVEMPTPGNTHTLVEVDFPDNALPYTHFSIVTSASRRFPIFTAENIDGELKIKLKRKDAWGFDPRIDRKFQVGHKEFYLPEPFDKGHMVRRENPGWGTTQDEAQLGELDSFVYTNAIPQMPQLNQKEWLSLEDYVLGHAKTEGFKICVFTGPVFSGDDPEYRSVQVPLDFWKVVVAIDAESGSLLTSSYLLSQEGFMPLEGFRYGPFKTYQVPLRRIEALADLTFSPEVQEADVFNGSEFEEMIQTARYVEIQGASDIVL
jgi:endonuclease G, mitochondrial